MESLYEKSNFSEIVRAIKSIKKFSGEEGEDVVEWLTNLVKISSYHSLSDKEAKIIFFMKLEGNARKWADRISRGSESYLSFRQIGNMLRLKFHATISKNLSFDDLIGTETKTNEQDFLFLLKAAHYVYKRGNLSMTSVIRSVINKTPLDIKDHVIEIAKGTSTWEDFYYKATDLCSNLSPYSLFDEAPEN